VFRSNCDIPTQFGRNTAKTGPIALEIGPQPANISGIASFWRSQSFFGGIHG